MSAILVLLAAASCNENEEAPTPFSVKDVETHFYNKTGDRLSRWELSPTLERLRDEGYPLPPTLAFSRFESDEDGTFRDVPTPVRFQRKYGEFKIVIWESEKQASREAIEPLEAARPDDRGIYWEYAPPDRSRAYWVATKLYGNVELTWFPGDGTKRVDERWIRLDKALSDLGRAPR